MRFETGIKTKIEGMEDIERIAKEIGKIKNVKAVYLFGSYARMCLYAIIDGKNKKISNRIMRYKLDNIKINIFNELPSFIRFTILREGKALLINNREFVDECKLSAMREYFDFKPFMERMCKEMYKCSPEQWIDKQMLITCEK